MKGVCMVYICMKLIARGRCILGFGSVWKNLVRVHELNR